MSDFLKVGSWSADKLLFIEPADKQGAMPSLNLRFKSKPKPDVPKDLRESLCGSGLYGILFNEPPDELCIYAGHFLPSDGKIVQKRWAVEIAGMTLRDQRAAISRRPFNTVLGEPDLREDIRQVLRSADDSLIRRRERNDQGKWVTLNDRGVSVSLNYLRFAIGNWDFFRSLEPGSSLSRFRFVHIRVRDARLDKAGIQAIKTAEDRLIAKIRPCCNDKCPPWGSKEASRVGRNKFLEWADRFLREALVIQGRQIARRIQSASRPASRAGADGAQGHATRRDRRVDRGLTSG